MNQSPIDIAANNFSVAVLWNRILTVDWNDVPSFHFIKEVNTVTGALPILANDTITYQNTEFKTLNIHFHAPSEHAFQGERTAMEAHLVHKVCY